MARRSKLKSRSMSHCIFRATSESASLRRRLSSDAGLPAPQRPRMPSHARCANGHTGWRYSLPSANGGFQGTAVESRTLIKSHSRLQIGVLLMSASHGTGLDRWRVHIGFHQSMSTCLIPEHPRRRRLMLNFFSSVAESGSMRLEALAHGALAPQEPGFSGQIFAIDA